MRDTSLNRTIVSSVMGLVGLLWAANMIQLGLRYSWGVALPQASAQLFLNGLESGTVAAAFYAGYVFAGIPSGMLADRFGVKRVITASLLGVAALCFIIGFSTSFAELVTAFLFSGVMAGPIFPSSLKALSERVDRNSRATGVGALETVSPFAMIATATLFPVVVTQVGWRLIYIALGLAALVVSGVYYIVAPSGTTRPSVKHVSIMVILKNRDLIWAVVVRLGGMWGIIGLSSWYYDIVFKYTGPLYAQILYLALSAAAVAGQLVGGIASDRYGRGGVATHGMLVFGLILAAASVARTPVLLFALAPPIGFFAFFWKSGLDTYILESVDDARRGSAAGLMNTVSQLGSLAAPIAVGYTIDMLGLSTPFPFIVLALGPLLASVAMIVSLSRRTANSENH